MSDWYSQDAAAAIEQFSSDQEGGLAAEEAERRVGEYGPNEIVDRGRRTIWKILIEQFKSLLVALLVAAAGVSLALGEFIDAGAIAAILILNALLGLWQEYRAEKAIDALRRLAAPTVKVRRGGQIVEVAARDIVPGDVVRLEAGDAVPADGRLFVAADLRVQEAALTGESAPVEKQADEVCPAETPLAERHNMVYMGTAAVHGRGEAVITATGMQTELGGIAQMLQAVEHEPTPLQRRLTRLGRTLVIAVLAIVVIFFGSGLLLGQDLKLMFLTAVSLAVAAVPEGLAAVVTIALALGAQRMLRRNALIRKLPAVEALGSVTVICSDKTGTLTRNEMRVDVIETPSTSLQIGGGDGLDQAEGKQEATQWKVEDSAVLLLIAGGALCNDATVEAGDGEPDRIVGDPTEGALVRAAAEAGLSKKRLEQALPRVGEEPFDSRRKRMTTRHRRGEQTIESLAKVLDTISGGAAEFAVTKGAVDSLVEVSSRVWTGDEIAPLDDRRREQILAAQDRLAADGERVLGVAIRPLEADEEAKGSLEHDEIFVGLIGMIDPPRDEARNAVETCKTAGVRPVMITGDHPLTARNIAARLGIAGEEEKAVTGGELAKFSQEELAKAARTRSIFARVSPEQKLRLVEALQAEGQIVAMTGDGVNDAPALKKADIGVAMGVTGTDVAQEAAEMVLRDDNFATIVAAVEEGRVIYDNIRKFIRYTLTSNAGEIWVMLLAPFLGMPLPLLPLQVLWVNLVTDGLPGLALSIEKGERDVMLRPPVAPGARIIDWAMGRDILWIGLLMGVVSLAMGYWHWLPLSGDDLAADDDKHAYWRTMVFTVLTVSQMGNAMAIRSSRDSLFAIGVFSNRPMLGAVGLTFALQIAVIYVPFMQEVFQTAALSLLDLAICFLFGAIVFWCYELQKWIMRMTTRRQPSATSDIS